MTFWVVLTYSFWFFVWVSFIWVLIILLGDLFRDNTIGGIGKAAWIIFLIFLPIIGALCYVIFRGGGMQERTMQHFKQIDEERRAYIREVAASPADELEKLVKLREQKVLSENEFQAQKKKIIG